MRYLRTLMFFALAVSIAACHTKKKTITPDYSQDVPAASEGSEPSLEYRPSRTHINDLVHTRLYVRFDYKKQYLYGTEEVTLAPHFYATDSLLLDAKGMDIKSVKLISAPTGDDKPLTPYSDLKYHYDGNSLRIQLDRTYKKAEQYAVSIEYTAKPNELTSAGSAAIHDAKGLYFIDPLDTIPDKPTQIWTQGETESARCWFPTIDAPDQKSTEEIYITVPKQYLTLSNGELVYGKDNNDGTRTDYWQQDNPHAPYLFMMAVGEFAEVKDNWRGKDVNYYVEKAYEPYARLVFGHTPEMLEFYSNTLGIEYPWVKFHQVVVRDFVSGAMENTSCVVHYGALQHNSREHLDETCESIVAHELFHHWFGDLVTCESWANLPLNESFANYGEYLWTEHKYGRTEADIHLKEYLDQYLSEAEGKQVNLIRYYHDKPEDMFDGHSYQKGGCVLHMLRKYTGDEAFFSSLNLYLTRKRYKTAEIHDLRLAFEEVTGEDLNWFFNQWFLGAGHPEIQVKHHYNAADKQYVLTVFQISSVYDNHFRLPVDVDFHYKNTTKRERIWSDKDSQTFIFKVPEKPTWVNFDAENQILGRVNEEKSYTDWETQLKQATLEGDKQQALENIAAGYADRQSAIELIQFALHDSSWKVREQALGKLQELGLSQTEYAPLNTILQALATKDPKSDVRAATIAHLYSNGSEDGLNTVKSMLNDSSYKVCSSVLYALAFLDRDEAFAFADKNRYTPIESLKTAVGYTIAITSQKNELGYLKSMVHKNTGNTKYDYITIIGLHLQNADPALMDEGIALLQSIGLESGDDISAKYLAKSTLQELAENYSNAIAQLRTEQGSYKKKSDAYKALEARIVPLKATQEKILRAADIIVL